jgi:cellulose biosynthesis protein BcsQ
MDDIEGGRNVDSAMGGTERKVIPWPRTAAGGGFDDGPDGPDWLGGGRGPRWPGMRVLAFASYNEGSGKTTLAAQTAVQAEIAGAGPVAILDTDPEGGLADWWNRRLAEYPAFAHTFGSRVGEDLSRLRELGIKTCIVDTPPAIATTIEHVIEAVDIVVIPCRPSPHDLRGAGATVELVERLGGRLIFVINAATPRARITAEAAIALSQYGTLAPGDDPPSHRLGGEHGRWQDSYGD